MNLLEIVGIAFGLAMDACAVSVATSVMLGGVNPRQIFRFAFHFGLFQAMMPVLGWFAGVTVSGYIENWDHWIAFALLAIIGGKALYSTLFCKEDEETRACDPTRGMSLIVLSVATSIDAFAVGLSFAMLNVRIWIPSLIIGLITGALSAGGMIIGGKLGKRFGKQMEITGGLVLIAIGVKIVIDHLFFN